MGSKNVSFILATLTILVASVFVIVFLAIQNNQERSQNMANNLNSSSVSKLRLSSPAFSEGSPIPKQYSCDGQNISPPLDIANVPANAKSLALIMHDPDAPVGDYVHWTMWNIPIGIKTIAANSVPPGAIQGLNSNGQNKYIGPCPPSGTHRYMFELYALDTKLNLPATIQRDELLKAMDGHIIAKHTLSGTFSAKQS